MKILGRYAGYAMIRVHSVCLPACLPACMHAFLGSKTANLLIFSILSLKRFSDLDSTGVGWADWVSTLQAPL